MAHKSEMEKLTPPYLLLQSAATEKSPNQSLDVDGRPLLLLLPLPLLPGLPGFVQELGLGALRYTEHCAPWERGKHNPLGCCTINLETDKLTSLC